MSEAPRRGIRLAIGLVFAASIAVRVAAADRELWLDETHSALLARMPLRDLIEFVKGDVHPPLYFLLLNAWRRWINERRRPGARSRIVSFGIRPECLLLAATFGPWRPPSTVVDRTMLHATCTLTARFPV